MILRYQARNKGFSSGGSMDVFIDDHQVARVTLTPGRLVTGPSWVWHNQHGPEWTLSSRRGTYELTLPDGTVAGRMQKKRLSRDVDLATHDGWHGLADHKGWGSGRTSVTSAGQPVATVTRATGLATRMFTQHETWNLAIHQELTVAAQYVVSAVPIVVDHLDRKASNSGA